MNGAEINPEQPAAAGDLRSQVLATLLKDNVDHLADAIEHGSVTLEGEEVVVHTSEDYRMTLDLDMGSLEPVVAKVVGRKVRVRLGDNLDQTEVSQIVSVDRPVPPGAAAGDSDASDIKERALADPAVQMVQKAFPGQVRDVRNLKGYTQ